MGMDKVWSGSMIVICCSFQVLKKALFLLLAVVLITKGKQSQVSGLAWVGLGIAYCLLVLLRMNLEMCHMPGKGEHLLAHLPSLPPLVFSHTAYIPPWHLII